jgi:hypothetical protein
LSLSWGLERESFDEMILMVNFLGNKSADVEIDFLAHMSE